jgi:hypothetical protein
MTETITIKGLKLNKFTWKWLQALHTLTAQNTPVLDDRTPLVSGLVKKELITRESDRTLRLTEKGNQAVADYRLDFQRKFPAQAALNASRHKQEGE